MYSLTQHSFVLWISKVTIVCLSMYYMSVIYLCIYLYVYVCIYVCICYPVELQKHLVLEKIQLYIIIDI